MRNLVVIWMCLIFVISGQARTITVDDDGPADFNNIQAAIDDANDGDEIVVADGTYTGEGNRDIDFLGKAITVKSESGPENCIIDCNGSELGPHRGFNFHSGETSASRVSGLTVVNGYGPINIMGSHPRSAAGAVYVYQSSPTIENCIFVQNSAAYFGGAVACTDSASPTLLNCLLVDNSTQNRGGAIYANFSSKLVVTKCEISRNSATLLGGGMYTESGCEVQVNNSVFNHNSALSSGALREQTGTGMIRDCIFIANTAQSKGGALGTFRSTLTLINCLFTGNFAGEQGGAVTINYDTKPRFINCTFAGNSAPLGNAFDCDSFGGYPSTVELTGCILWNGADEIWNNDDSTITIIYSDIQEDWPGVGNIDADPWFVEPGYWDVNGTPGDANDDFWVEGDYRLLDGSPCIDTGDPNHISEPNEADLDGKPRVLDGDEDGVAVVDMGAYEYESVPDIEAVVKIAPKTLNLASKSKWIMCVIRLPEDYNVADIDPNSILLEDEIPGERVWLGDEFAVAKFRRGAVQEMLSEVETPAEVELVVSGELSDGTIFEGTDTIRVIDKGGACSAEVRIKK